ncbi:MAG: UDP-N-acetylmuramoyl-L-alanyl-D-glutamate--2,6-diaminopimelate ligase [Alphaproteobacteria bacterium]|nr:UDP-N-acetylmuramoyl-L-alanyl-D-glutamate--2,6-diaminopimelate ligase [Alphaproteobacteria bacterium]
MDLTPFVQKGILIPLGACLPSFNSLAIDSRQVEKESLFVAIPGSQHDGINFVEEALGRGARGVVASQGVGQKMANYFKERYPKVSFFEAVEIRKVASLLAAYFYPLQPDNIVAVTGTSGKTSVVSFIRQIWHHLGLSAVSLGTLGLIIEGRPLPPPTGTGGLNTPDPVKLHQILQVLKEQGIDYLAFEASSHGLHQHRLDSVRLKAAIFTNFSNDHLDYHHTMNAYLEAKMRLFKDIMAPHMFAILNSDMIEYSQLLDLCQKRGLKPVTFGKNADTIRLISIIPKMDSQDVLLCIEGKSYNLTLPFVGQFQVYNVIAALAAVMACGGNVNQAVEACLSLRGVPGRLEQAAPGIYVDYSHKPDALSLALKALRAHTKGQLWVVFGCGGERDTVKRPMMGEIAAKLADKVIITDDNPRHEDPAEIRRQILEKCPNAREIPSRREAIMTAIKEMKTGDVLLVAGKGHETYQIIGDTQYPFSDVEEVKRCIQI